MNNRRANVSLNWRLIDIVTVAVLAVATGLVFIGWNFVGGNLYNLFSAAAPGLGGIPTGIWFIGGIFGGLIVGKPGAAFAVETLGAVVSLALGSPYGIETVYAGFWQGLGAEIVFLLVMYRSYQLPVAMLAGAGAGFGGWILGLISGNLEKGIVYNLIYLVCVLASGAVLAGLLGWLLTRALAATGVLSNFPAGRYFRERATR